MVLANILISQIYAAHPMVVVIHNSLNPNMNLTLFYPDLFHVALDLFIYSWRLPRNF